jgi:U3 small nucleolar RNA-associated protein 15
VFSVITELIHRDALHTALSGRDDLALAPILRFLLRHIADPRFGVTACDVLNVIIG